MEFRLVYDGRLPAAGRSEPRNREKEHIRRVFDRQLAELFSTHPALKGWSEKDMSRDDYQSSVDSGGGPTEHSERILRELFPGDHVRRSVIEVLGCKYERCGRKYVPLIDSRFGCACALDILFLRRDHPGNLIAPGGDIDNRIKVLFDALRLPQNRDEVFLDPDRDGPTYVLLEDDRLIVDVRVVTDRLLTPRAEGEHVNDVRLVVHVKTVIINPKHWGALVFGA